MTGFLDAAGYHVKWDDVPHDERVDALVDKAVDDAQYGDGGARAAAYAAIAQVLATNQVTAQLELLVMQQASHNHQLLERLDRIAGHLDALNENLTAIDQRLEDLAGDPMTNLHDELTAITDHLIRRRWWQRSRQIQPTAPEPTTQPEAVTAS